MLRPLISRRNSRSRESGVTIALVALAIFSMIAMAGLSIDIGTLYQASAEAQRTADAAALAAARTLSLSGMTGDPANSSGLWTNACLAATQAAEATANQNTVGGSAPSSISVIYLPGGGKDCSTATAAFGVNPMVNVTVTQANLPTYFARIWGNTANTVSATATAEVYNPSNSARSSATNAPIPVQPRCVKPIIIPNVDPGSVPNCTSTDVNNLCKKFINSDGTIVNPGIRIAGSGTNTTGVIGEIFQLNADCNSSGTCNSGNGGTFTLTPGVNPSGILQYVPGQIVGTPVAVPTCATTNDYQKAIAGCDQTTPYQCGVQAGSLSSENTSYVNLNENPGGLNGDAITAGKCLIGSDRGGGDQISTAAYPYQITAGAGNPTGVTGLVTTSDSIITLPIYDGSQLQPNGSNQAPVTIVGFLQVFVDPNLGSSTYPLLTVLNIAGCGNGVSPAAQPVYGTSPVPVRLITPTQPPS